MERACVACEMASLGRSVGTNIQRCSWAQKYSWDLRNTSRYFLEWITLNTCRKQNTKKEKKQLNYTTKKHYRRVRMFSRKSVLHQYTNETRATQTLLGTPNSV